jgi:sugar lactone lactonase YvrE
MLGEPRGWRARGGTGALLSLFACVFALAAWTPPPAAGYVYWSDASEDGIWRATLGGATDGFSPFIAGPSQGIAVDGSHVYWAGYAEIGRARLDGSGRQEFWIGALLPFDVATDGSHVYWSNFCADPSLGCASDDDPPTGSIGRANLDGSGVDQAFIGGLGGPEAVAVDSQHIYWSGWYPAGLGASATIGRANLDGTGVEPAFIGLGEDGATGLAVDGAHIYWSTGLGGTIGRANLDGTGVQPALIAGGDLALEDVAVDDRRLYFTVGDSETMAVGRANLDGSGVELGFIPDPVPDVSGQLPDFGFPTGIAVDSLPPCERCDGLGTVRAKKRQRQYGQRIRVRVTIAANQQLTATASGKVKASGRRYELKQKQVQVAAGAQATLTLKPKSKRVSKKIASALGAGRTATARLIAKLSGDADAVTEKLRVRLTD